MKENESATSISISIGVPSNGKNRYYKFWALSAILLLAFWSLFTGSITLKSTSGNLSLFSDDVEDFPNYYDFDILVPNLSSSLSFFFFLSFLFFASVN